VAQIAVTVAAGVIDLGNHPNQIIAAQREPKANGVKDIAQKTGLGQEPQVIICAQPGGCKRVARPISAFCAIKTAVIAVIHRK